MPTMTKTLIALIVLLAACGSTASPPAAHATASASPTETTPSPPVTLLAFAGNGIKTSPEFQAPDHWRLTYSYDCSSFSGGKGNFAVFLYQGSDLVDVVVNELGAGGTATTDVYRGGKLHLQASSECQWQMTAQS